MAQQGFMLACADKWKKLSEDEKQQFKESAEKDKIRFDNEMANYTPPKTEASGKKTRKEKKMKDPNEPKRGMSSFMFFNKEIRAQMKEENPQSTITAKVLGEMWAKLEEKEKEKYEAMAKEDRERYSEEMKAFKKGDYVVPSTSQVAMEAEE
ncbi:High mobility group box 1 [Desmophyllum pertusum]|uniref:High mobility group box 1 n=1 Tax=Desmophyllum pertusum TaxID=174260 RepID=A0A9W9YM38_9CNID|nr:High mobility group box 1 [Desmophyllum pertusum]